MTLAEMSTFVCNKVRARDTNAVADCKGFLAQRYKMIWEDQLWKDALRGYDFTFDPTALTYSSLPFGNYLSARGGVWQMPSGVDRVLALRKASGRVAVEDQFDFYRTSVDAFVQEGEPVRFVVLGQAARDLSGLLTTVEAESVRVFCADAADTNLVVRVQFIDLDGETITQDIAIDTSGTYINPAVILSVSKPATTGRVDFTLDGDYVLRLLATDTAHVQHVRIRLTPKPTVSTELKALVKLKAQALDDDGDVPQLRGIENTLLAFAQGDMLERQRRYGQAQAKFAEGAALLDQLKRTEVMQEAQLTRIQPEVLEVSGTVGEWEYPSKGYI
jgi:hypothetical protein